MQAAGQAEIDNAKADGRWQVAYASASKAEIPSDLQVALVELMAYAGDRLSYYQDAVATEAYLGTARKRISVRRHAQTGETRPAFQHQRVRVASREVRRGADAQ